MWPMLLMTKAVNTRKRLTIGKGVAVRTVSGGGGQGEAGVRDESPGRHLPMPFPCLPFSISPFPTYYTPLLAVSSALSTLNQTVPLVHPDSSHTDPSLSQPRYLYLPSSLPKLFLLSTLCPLCEHTPFLPNPVLSPQTLLLPGPLPCSPSLRIFSVFSVTKLISGSRKYSEATQRPFSRPGGEEDEKAWVEESLQDSREAVRGRIGPRMEMGNFTRHSQSALL